MNIWEGLAQIVGSSHEDSGWSSSQCWRNDVPFLTTWLPPILSPSPFKGFSSLWPFSTIWFLRIELSGWVVLPSYLPSVCKPGAPWYLVSLRDKSSENQSLHSTVKVNEQEMGLCFSSINTYLAQTNMFCLWTENNGSKARARNDSCVNMLTLRTRKREVCIAFLQRCVGGDRVDSTGS